MRCGNCGLAFSRKSYTYKNTRVFWICPGFNNRGSHFCDNRTTIEESDILENLKNRFEEIIGDKDEFISGVIKNIPESKPEKQISEIEKLNSKKEKYKTMYINGIIGIEELKTSADVIGRKIKEAENGLKSNGEKKVSRSEIEFLSDLKNWNNTAIKRLIESITVGKNGEVCVVVKKFN